MVFSSNTFLFLFLPTVIAVYYLVPLKLRDPVLLIFSLLFYGWGEPGYLWIMIVVIAENYLLGFAIDRYRGNATVSKFFLVLSVVINLSILGYYKYTGFIIESVQQFVPIMKSITIPDIKLPLGISFYIFQSMSYTIDVYRGETGVQKNPLTFGTYVTLFPQLIAGPIVRYRDIEEQLKERTHSYNMFASGVTRFIIGLGKKVLIANQMGSMWNLLSTKSGSLSAWVCIIAFSLQIYFDFSGYSDMAIGLGRMFGFEFLENFNYPYISKSVTEFWRRWHISLSTWFKEYVYIPLGGNRHGRTCQIFNILAVWALTGLWHGASWNFVLWGLYYALLLIMEKLFLLRTLEKLPSVFAHVYTLLMTAFGWVIFSFDDFAAFRIFMVRLFSFEGTTEHELHCIAAFLPIMAAGIIGATPLMKELFNRYSNSKKVTMPVVLLLSLVFLLSVASITSGGFNPFIYFRF